MSDSLDDLLSQLCTGDRAAAELAFRQFEPFLRNVVRRSLGPGLRAKFDSEDIVQSVWGTLLKGFRESGWRFRDVNHLRAFLIKATRNRFLDRVRQHSRRAECEQSLAEVASDLQPATAEPRPSQHAQGDELWQQVLAICPPKHQELLRLKRAGLSLDEIAAQTGLHRDSVRRVLRLLARRLAFHAGPGDEE